MASLKHLAWIPAGAGASFFASFLFGDVLPLGVDLYYLVYFSVIAGFLTIYWKATDLHLGPLLSRRLALALILGVAVGVLMVQNVLSRPETASLSGGTLAWALGWRGLAYGAVDGLILHAFPWLVVWRAFDGERGRVGRKLKASALAWASIIMITTVYHLGYADFRSQKIVQPNVGSTIMSVPTLLSANPAASVVSHVFLHVAAVLHCPDTELFLPPHPEGRLPASETVNVSSIPFPMGSVTSATQTYLPGSSSTVK
jgi:hypothetical protein